MTDAPFIIYTKVKGTLVDGGEVKHEVEYWMQAPSGTWGPFTSQEMAEEFGRNYTRTQTPKEPEVLCPTCGQAIKAQYEDPSAERNFFD